MFMPTSPVLIASPGLDFIASVKVGDYSGMVIRKGICMKFLVIPN